VTRQSSQVLVCWWVQSSQSMISGFTHGAYAGGMTATGDPEPALERPPSALRSLHGGLGLATAIAAMVVAFS
jgi:hypothetical protein